MNVKVLGRRLLVERIDTPAPTSTLIEVVKYDKEPSQFAVVLKLGHLVVEDVKPGAVVVTKQYAGTPVKIEDRDLFLIMEDDVLAVMEK